MTRPSNVELDSTAGSASSAGLAAEISGPAPRYPLYDPHFNDRAHRVYAEMRERCPVYHQPGLNGHAASWFITRYDDVQAVLQDDRRFARDFKRALPTEEAARAPEDPILSVARTHMMSADGEEHRRLRSAVSSAFTPRAVERLRPRTQQIADQLLDRVAERGHMELVADYALPLPLTVICEVLGVDEPDHDQFRAWSETLFTPIVDAESGHRYRSSIQAFAAYLREIFAERRRSPRDDLISALVRTAGSERAGAGFGEAELFGTVIALIVAGHETTAGLIVNGLLCLLRHPERLAEARRDPQRVPSAIEEVLRYDGPVQRAIVRWAVEDVELRGKKIGRGELVVPVLAAANRDPRQFRAPERFDISRDPAHHLAFGRGPHYCLGAALARMEGEIGLGTLLRRLPDARPSRTEDRSEWHPAPILRVPRRVELTWTVTPGRRAGGG